MMRTARLMVTYDCRRNCEGCCNKNWKYDPPVPNYEHYPKKENK